MATLHLVTALIDYKPGITIVIPLFNTEHYVEECLASVFAQSYAEHGGVLSVICVDDGSTDNSANAVLKMFDFADSVECRLVSHDKNRGLAAARNTGLKEVRTKYVMFLDSDDLLRPKTVDELYAEMEAHQSDVGIFEYKYFSPSGKNWPRNYSASLFTDRTYLLDSPKENLAAIHSLSACNKIYLSSRLAQIEFPEKRSYAEDVEFWFEVLSNDPKVIIVNGLSGYLYRKREDSNNSSIMDIGSSEVSSYFEYLDILECIESKYRVRDNVFYQSVSWFCQKSLFYYLSRLGLLRSVASNQSSVDFFIRARALVSKFEIDPRLPAYQIACYRVLVSNFWRCILHIGVLHRARALTATIIGKCRALNLNVLRRGYSFFSIDHLRELPELSKYILSSNAAHNREGIWLVGERGSDAGDNAFAVFKHLSHDPLSNIKPYYVCSGSCYNKLHGSYDNVVLYGSRRHRAIFRQAGTLVSTHSRGNIEPFKNKYALSLFSSNYQNKKYLFLGHGVTKDNMRRMLGYGNKFNAQFDYFWCGSKLEYRDVLARYGYNENAVKLGPLPRWSWPLKAIGEGDLNLSEVNNVMLMFTWRSVFGRSHRNSQSIKLRFETEYLSCIKELIANPRLKEFSTLNNVGFHLVLHPETEITLKRYKLELPEVNFVTVHKPDRISELIRSCDLLVTDYSSVAFDFAFFNKPTIYYQFDQSRFRSDHYQAGYFDYEVHGFGPVCTSLEGCVGLIEKHLDHKPRNFKLRRHIHFYYGESEDSLAAGLASLG